MAEFDGIALQRLWLDLTGSGAAGFTAGGTWHDGSQLRHPPTLGVAQLGIVAKPLTLLDLRPEVALSAEAVRLRAAPRGADWPFRLDFTNGRAVVSCTHAELESLLRQVMSEVLRPYKVAVSAVQVQIQAPTPQTLRFAVQLKLRRSLLSASLDLAGQLVIDEQLRVRFRDLQIEGRGLPGLLVATSLRAQFQALGERPWHLGKPLLGCLRLTSVACAVGQRFEVSGTFGPCLPTPAAEQAPAAPRPRPVLDVYILDRGRNPRARQLLDDVLAGRAVIVLTPEQSAGLLGNEAQLGTADPVLLVLDGGALADQRQGEHGLRFDLGTVADHPEAEVALRRLVELLEAERLLAEIVTQVRQEVQARTVREALRLLSGF